MCHANLLNQLKILYEFHHFLQEYVPVCSHWSCCSLLAFVLEGNHSVGAHMPRPCLDLIECKLEKILLKDNKKTVLKHRNTHQELKALLL